MKTIGTFALTHLHLASNLDFHTSVYDATMVTLFTQAEWKSLREEYQKQIEVLRAVVRRQAASILTPQIREADRVRDNTMNQLFLAFRSAAKSNDPEIQQIGKDLLTLVKPYRKDPHDQLTDQSQQINGMLNQILIGQPAEWLATINAKTVAQRLGSENNRFLTLYRERALEQEQRPANGIDSREQRRVTDTLYHAIVQLANSLSVAAASGVDTGYDPVKLDLFIETVNGLIVQYKHVIANQGKTRTPDIDHEIADSARRLAVLHDDEIHEEQHLEALEADKEAAAARSIEQIERRTVAAILDDEAPLREPPTCK